MATVELELELLGSAQGAPVVGAVAPVVARGVAVVGAASSGTAGAAVEGVTGAGAVAGGGLPKVSSRTDFGTCVRVDIT